MKIIVLHGTDFDLPKYNSLVIKTLKHSHNLQNECKNRYLNIEKNSLNLTLCHDII